jgi:PIN domain nuclease of toxin-antitoxin system
MKLLLDTHTFLYAIGAPQRLSNKVRKALQDPAVERWISAASLWEIAVKIQIGKLDLPANEAFFREQSALLHAKHLAVDFRHSLRLFQLPLIHRDPFDRLLIAQAIEEGLTLVSKDERISEYQVPTYW